jgi:hypothetical protein
MGTMGKNRIQHFVPKFTRIKLIMILIFFSTVSCSIPEAHRKQSNDMKNNRSLGWKMHQLFQNNQQVIGRFVNSMERKDNAIERTNKDQIIFFIQQLIHWIVASELLTMTSFLFNKALSSKLVQNIAKRKKSEHTTT